MARTAMLERAAQERAEMQRLKASLQEERLRSSSARQLLNESLEQAEVRRLEASLQQERQRTASAKQALQERYQQQWLTPNQPARVIHSAHGARKPCPGDAISIMGAQVTHAGATLTGALMALAELAALRLLGHMLTRAKLSGVPWPSLSHASLPRQVQDAVRFSKSRSGYLMRIL